MRNKKLYQHFNIFFIVLTIIFSSIFVNFSYAETTTSQTPTKSENSTEQMTEAVNISNFCEPGKIVDVKAEAAILIDADTGLTLYEKNADKVLYPASITKIMTTLLGCEYGKFDEKVTHSHNAIFGIGYGSSTMGMQEGETISFKSALLGVMMCSANETSMAVAEKVAGSVDKFVEMMNSKAKELGCKNTHFANPHGFHDNNHYTTARDMSLITKAAVKNKDFAEIWGTLEYSLPATNIVKTPRTLYNKSKILHKESKYYYSGIIGAKTGFHDQAMNTLVCCAERNGVKLISVVMKDAGYDLTYTDSKKLFDYGFSQCENKKLYDGSQYSAEVPVVQTYNENEYPIDKVQVGIEGSFEKYVPKVFKAEEVTATPVIEKKKELPVEAGDKLGEMVIKYKDIELGKMDIVAKTSINKLSDNEMAKKELIANIKKYAKIALKYGSIPVGAIVIIIIIVIIGRAVSKPKKKKSKTKNKKKVKNKGNSKKNTNQTDLYIFDEKTIDYREPDNYREPVNDREYNRRPPRRRRR